MKMNTYRNQHFIALAFILVTTAPFICADEPSPKPVAGDASPAQVSQAIPKIQESVTHFVLFSGPKDVIKDWMINTTLMSPVTIADPPLTIEPDVRQFAPNIPAGISVGVDTSPIRVSIGGSFPAENGGLIYQIILKSYKPTSKGELEELFVKYLKAVDQKLFDYYKQFIYITWSTRDELHKKYDREYFKLQDLMNKKRVFLERTPHPLPVQVLTESLSEIEKELMRSDVEIVTTNTKRNQLQKSLDRIDNSTDGGLHESESKQLNEFRTRLTAAITDRAALAAKEGPDHKEIKEIDRKIDDLLMNFRNSQISTQNRTAVATKLQEYMDLYEDLAEANKRLRIKRDEIERQRIAAISRDDSIKDFDEQAEELRRRMRERQDQIREFDDLPWDSIKIRLSKDQMGMITILDPASKPETKAEEKAPSSDAKESKPARDSKEEKDPTSPAPAGSPK